MTKAHLLQVLIIDHEALGVDDVERTLEDTKYPNRCISPHVIKSQSADIGNWEDDNPLNFSDQQAAEVERLFSPWQPIETAPKDGTEILVSHEYGVSMAQFDSGLVCIKDEDLTNVWVTNYCEDYWYTEILNPEPTHWMSLPNPPQG